MLVFLCHFDYDFFDFRLTCFCFHFFLSAVFTVLSLLCLLDFFCLMSGSLLNAETTGDSGEC